MNGKLSDDTELGMSKKMKDKIMKNLCMCVLVCIFAGYNKEYKYHILQIRCVLRKIVVL